VRKEFVGVAWQLRDGKKVWGEKRGGGGGCGGPSPRVEGGRERRKIENGEKG